jgi:hypothetical protein
MLRIRTLLFLLPVFLLGSTFHPARADASPPRMDWKPGIYIGPISISGHEFIALKPLPKGTLHEEQTLEILPATGYMSIFISNNGTMRINISVPFKFRYKDWSQVKDEGTGICQGQRSEAVGFTKLHSLVSEAPIPLGESFLVNLPPFELGVFNGLTVQFGEHCPDVDKKRMKASLEAGFNAMFVNGIVFEGMEIPGGISGVCRVPGFQSKGDLVFNCKWRLWNFYKE